MTWTDLEPMAIVDGANAGSWPWRAPTKPGGSGVGLALSRQIVEAHGGTLRLDNRNDARGAVATLEIPGAARRR